ncbi:MAG: NAD-binding protein [Zavarzinella sp.]
MIQRLLSRRQVFAISLPFILILIGTIGYKLIGGPQWSWLDALYMSAITLTTLGYSEVHPLRDTGRLFTICFSFLGIFTLFYIATEIVRSIISLDIRKAIKESRMTRALEEMNDHIIVCGAGRMGRMVCEEFERNHLPYVVIDRDLKRLDEINFESGVPLVGDCTSDEVLAKAHLPTARSLVSLLPSDADNLYVILTARSMNTKLQLISRAESENSEAKLKRVGANHVVAPYVIGGHRVAQAVLRPTVHLFFEQASSHKTESYRIEEVGVAVGSPFVGRSLKDAGIGIDLKVVVITLHQPAGDTIFNPDCDVTIEAGSTLLVVGMADEIVRLQQRTRRFNAKNQ